MRRLRRDDGQDLVEFALIAPLFFLLLFGILEFGLVIWHYNTVSIAAREGARAAIMFGTEGHVATSDVPGCDTLGGTGRAAAARIAACEYAASMGVTGLDVTASSGEYEVQGGDPDPELCPCMCLPTIVVSAGYSHTSATGLLRPIRLEASSTMLEDAGELFCCQDTECD